MEGYDVIYKVGAIILNPDRELLVVRKEVPGRRTFIIPGGRREDDESDGETCIRELREELAVEVSSLRYFSTFRETAEFESVPLVMPVFVASIVGTPVATSEIVEISWIRSSFKTDGFEVGSTIERHIIPMLIEQRLLA